MDQELVAQRAIKRLGPRMMFRTVLRQCGPSGQSAGTVCGEKEVTHRAVGEGEDDVASTFRERRGKRHTRSTGGELVVHVDAQLRDVVDALRRRQNLPPHHRPRLESIQIDDAP
jgi:hypothetical protein